MHLPLSLIVLLNSDSLGLVVGLGFRLVYKQVSCPFRIAYLDFARPRANKEYTRTALHRFTCRHGSFLQTSLLLLSLKNHNNLGNVMEFNFSKKII